MHPHMAAVGNVPSKIDVPVTLSMTSPYPSVRPGLLENLISRLYLRAVAESLERVISKGHAKET